MNYPIGFKELTSETLAGTKGYIAPEMENSDRYNYTIDLWSIGVLAFEMMFKNYDRSVNVLNLIPDVVHDKWPLENNLSFDAMDFISRFLMINPEERMTIPEALKHSFITKYIP